jgi:hypothetical protein
LPVNDYSDGKKKSYNPPVENRQEPLGMSRLQKIEKFLGQRKQGRGVKSEYDQMRKWEGKGARNDKPCPWCGWGVPLSLPFSLLPSLLLSPLPPPPSHPLLLRENRRLGFSSSHVIVYNVISHYQYP